MAAVRFVRMPRRRSYFRPQVVTRTRTRVVQVARRGMTAARNLAKEESHTIGAVVAAGVLGYAKKNGMLDTLPHIDALGVTGTYGVAAFIAGRKLHSKHLQHAATGLLSIAMFEWASGEGVSGDDEDVGYVDPDEGA